MEGVENLGEVLLIRDFADCDMFTAMKHMPSASFRRMYEPAFPAY